jgi:hypothetical protein
MDPSVKAIMDPSVKRKRKATTDSTDSNDNAISRKRGKVNLDLHDKGNPVHKQDISGSNKETGGSYEPKFGLNARKEAIPILENFLWDFGNDTNVDHSSLLHATCKTHFKEPEKAWMECHGLPCTVAYRDPDNDQQKPLETKSNFASDARTISSRSSGLGPPTTASSNKSGSSKSGNSSKKKLLQTPLPGGVVPSAWSAVHAS